ncbi:MAG: Bax inhibitor-1/YccA family protein [Deinococcaceae bacterium]
MYNGTLNRTRSQQVQVMRAFLNRTYSWMAAGLILTAFISWFTWQNPGLQAAVLDMRVVLVIIQLALVFSFGWVLSRVSAAVAGVLFSIYAVVTGLTLSAIFLVYSPAAITSSFVSTAVMFGTMSLWGYTTRRDLTGWGNILMMGLIGLLVAMVVNVFLGSGPLGFLISAVGVVLFALLTAYDTQKLREMALHGVDDAQGQTAEKLAIFGALTLYLDFINLFLMLLRLFGGGRSSD